MLIGWLSNDWHRSDDVWVLATRLNPVLGLQVWLSNPGRHSGLEKVHVPVLPLQLQYWNFDYVQILMSFNRLIFISVLFCFPQFSVISVDLLVLSIWNYSIPLNVLCDCSRYNFCLLRSRYLSIISIQILFVYCVPDMFYLLWYRYVSSIAFQICFVYFNPDIIHISRYSWMLHNCSSGFRRLPGCSKLASWVW